MPVKNCSENGKNGYKWGDSGKCYLYNKGDETGRKAAKKKAINQGLAVTGGTLTEEKATENMRKIKSMRLIKPVEIVERSEAPFGSVTETAIDATNNIVKGVCVFGTRESANKRIYQDKAIQSLARFTEGAKMFLNHPGHSEQKEHDGVRRIQEWAGIFVNARQDKDRVFADLKVRPSHWDLIEDVALMQPHGVGNSINARVKVYSDDKGMESVVDMDALHSIDLVSSAATTSSLFESAMTTIDQQAQENIEFEMLRETLEGKVKDRFTILMIEEGIIQDKVDNDKLRSEISQVGWVANDLIDRIVYDNDLGIEEKKKKVIAVFDDLDSEIKKRLGKLTKESKLEDDNMEITLEMLKTQHPDIIAAIIAEASTNAEFKKVSAQVTEMQENITALEGTVAERDKTIGEQMAEIAVLKTENTDLKVKLDEHAVAEAMTAKSALADKLLGESKLPEVAKTPVFRDLLLAVEEKGEGDSKITVEAGMLVLIKDRQESVLAQSGKPKGMGDDYNLDNDLKGKEKSATVEEAAGKFLKTVGR